MRKRKEEMGKRRRKKKDYDIINDNDDLIAEMIKNMKQAAEVTLYARKKGTYCGVASVSVCLSVRPSVNNWLKRRFGVFYQCLNFVFRLADAPSILNDILSFCCWISLKFFCFLDFKVLHLAFASL